MPFAKMFVEVRLWQLPIQINDAVLGKAGGDWLVQALNTAIKENYQITYNSSFGIFLRMQSEHANNTRRLNWWYLQYLKLFEVQREGTLCRCTVNSPEQSHVTQLYRTYRATRFFSHVASCPSFPYLLQVTPFFVLAHFIATANNKYSWSRNSSWLKLLL